MAKYPRKAWLVRDGHVQATIFSDQTVETGEGTFGLPALVMDPNLNGGKEYLAVISDESLWTYVEPDLVPENAPKYGYAVYQEDEEHEVFVTLAFSEEEAQAYRRTNGYLGYAYVQLPSGSLSF